MQIGQFNYANLPKNCRKCKLTITCGYTKPTIVYGFAENPTTWMNDATP